MLRPLLLAPLLLLTACAANDAAGPDAAPAGSKASFDSPLFARGPEVIFKDGQYLAVLYPKENWTVVVADVAVDYQSGRTLVFASRLQHGPPAGPVQTFPLDIPASVEPAFLQKALYWQEPDGFAHPLTVRAVP